MKENKTFEKISRIYFLLTQQLQIKHLLLSRNKPETMNLQINRSAVKQTKVTRRDKQTKIIIMWIVIIMIIMIAIVTVIRKKSGNDDNKSVIITISNNNNNNDNNN